MDAIARAYVRRIERGVIMIEDVPEQIREKVEALMSQDETEYNTVDEHV